MIRVKKALIFWIILWHSLISAPLMASERLSYGGNFDKTPTVIKVKILELLDIKDLERLSLTCKGWNKLINDKKFPCSTEDLEKISDFTSNASSSLLPYGKDRAALIYWTKRNSQDNAYDQVIRIGSGGGSLFSTPPLIAIDGMEMHPIENIIPYGQGSICQTPTSLYSITDTPIKILENNNTFSMKPIFHGDHFIVIQGQDMPNFVQSKTLRIYKINDGKVESVKDDIGAFCYCPGILPIKSGFLALVTPDFENSLCFYNINIKEELIPSAYSGFTMTHFFYSDNNSNVVLSEDESTLYFIGEKINKEQKPEEIYSIVKINNVLSTSPTFHIFDLPNCGLSSGLYPRFLKYHKGTLFVMGSLFKKKFGEIISIDGINGQCLSKRCLTFCTPQMIFTDGGTLVSLDSHNKKLHTLKVF